MIGFLRSVPHYGDGVGCLVNEADDQWRLVERSRDLGIVSDKYKWCGVKA